MKERKLLQEKQQLHYFFLLLLRKGGIYIGLHFQANQGRDMFKREKKSDTILE